MTTRPNLALSCIMYKRIWYAWHIYVYMSMRKENASLQWCLHANYQTWRLSKSKSPRQICCQSLRSRRLAGDWELLLQTKLGPAGDRKHPRTSKLAGSRDQMKCPNISKLRLWCQTSSMVIRQVSKESTTSLAILLLTNDRSLQVPVLHTMHEHDAS